DLHGSHISRREDVRAPISCGGVDCQRAHRKQHKKACKLRAAELKDEELYSQGLERPEGDFCPICTLPIALPVGNHSVFNSCCTKRVCYGCLVTQIKKGLRDCPFCRAPTPTDDADAPDEFMARVRARAERKDPAAINNLGEDYLHGRFGLTKDVPRAVELWTEAAELGSIQALFNLGNAYYHEGGIRYDQELAAEFYRKAAMRGHVQSRHNLGCFEGQNGDHGRALRHYMISARLGYGHSIESIGGMFRAGEATKEQYAEALRGYRDAVEETKSHERDAGMAFMKRVGPQRGQFG
ncbi:hypothetical protein THAOC_21606, partial [Thalassiosira oceanica]